MDRTNRQRHPSVAQATLLWFFAAFAVLVGGGMLGLFARRQLAPAAATDPAGAEALLRELFTSNPTWIALGTAVNELAALLALAVTCWFFRSRLSVVLPGKAPRLNGTLGTLLLVFGAAPLANTVSELVRRGLALETTASSIVTAAARGATDLQFGLLLVTLAVLPALVEEAIFRGFITAAFEKNRWLALLVPSLMFGLFHIEPSQAAGTTLLGIAFGLGRLATGSLWPSIIAHACYNASVLSVVRNSEVIAQGSHRIQWLPVLIGCATFALGVIVLRGHTRPERGSAALTADTEDDRHA